MSAATKKAPPCKRLTNAQCKHVEDWIDALRSGEYRQASGLLRDVQDTLPDGVVEGYCCLGVGCDIYAKAFKTVEWTTRTNEETEERYFLFQKHDCDLPLNVTEWFGLADSTGAMVETAPVGPTRASSLTAANDQGVSFTDIADLIESEYRGHTEYGLFR